MNVKKLLFVIIVLGMQSIVAQIKIGDNPQNLDASSVLELESNTRVLVITRINTAQMNAIVPLSGAMVYNTDDQCLFYFDGTNWINLCNSFGVSVSNTVAGNRIGTLTQTDGSSSDINETITSLSDTGNGNITYNKEDGTQDIVAKANIIDNGDGTYTFTNNDGTDVILDTRASSNVYDNTISGLTATDVQAAIDEVVLGSVDDQNLTGASLSGANILQIDIENGGSTNVDLSALDNSGTDDQNISGSSLVGTNLTIGIENGTNETIDLSSLISTDDQNISGSGLAGNILTIGIENGTNETVDLSALVGTDDQTLTLAANSLSIEDGNSVDLSPYLDNTDIQDLTLTGNTLAVSGDPNTDVDLSPYLDNTDDQNISGSGLAGTTLTIGIENGTNETVNLASLVDDADADPANEINTAFAVNAGNLEITDSNGTLTVPVASLGTDDQNLTLAANSLSIEDGNSVDLSPYLDNTDIQDLTLTGNTLAVSGDPNTDVDLSPYLDNTDDQNISGSGLAGTTLTIGIENGTNETVNLASLVDDADADPANEINTAFAVNAGNLEITDSNGTLTVPVASLGTDDQTLTLAANSLSIEDGNSVDLSPYLDNTDIQDLTLTGNTLAVSGDPNTDVDLSPYLDNTDDQNISGSGLAGTTLTIGIENGTNETVNLASLVDDADADPANEINTAFAVNAGNLEITDSNGTLTVPVASLGTDDQNLTLAANSLSIEDGNSVDLSPYLDNTDIQDLTLTGNTLAVSGDPNTDVDLSPYLDNTDDQNISGSGLAGTTLTIGIENGTNETVNLASLVDDADADPANEINTAFAVNAGNLEITDSNGTLTVPVASLGTDDQTLTLAANSLSIEDGNSVDLSPYLDNTDNQNIEGLAVNVGTNMLTVGIEDGASQTIDLSHLDDSGTDDQNISGSGLAGTTLTIGIENGTNETVNLASLVDDADADPANEINTAFAVNAGNLEITDSNGTLTVPVASLGTDDQNLTLAANSLSIEDGNSVDLSPYLDNTDIQDLTLTGNTLAVSGDPNTDVDLSPYLDNTDDQNISGSGLAGTTLTIGIENGTNETVNLASLVDDADADPANEINTAFAVNAGNLEITDSNGTLTVPVASLGTDDQNLTLAANSLSIEDGNSVDLNPYLDNTDIQDLTLTGNTLAVSGDPNTDVDLSPYLDNTDDQNISGSGLAGTTLTIGIENGTNETVNLASLVDDADADPANEINTAFAVNAGNLEITDSNGTLTVPVASLGTDDQTAAEVSYDNTTSGLTATNVKDAIDELEASGPTSVFHAMGFINGVAVNGALGGVFNSYNIASITDVAVGQYKVNFTTPASNINYVVQLSLRAAPNGTFIQVTGQTANDFTVWIVGADDSTFIDAQWYFSVLDF